MRCCRDGLKAMGVLACKSSLKRVWMLRTWTVQACAWCVVTLAPFGASRKFEAATTRD